MDQPDLTVAAVAENHEGFLVVEERADGRAVINQPAGHVEAGESLTEAVIRETLEETAWHFEPEAITGIYLWHPPGRPRPFLRVSFCGRCTRHDAQRPLDDGIVAAHWLPVAKLPLPGRALRSPMVLRTFADYSRGQRMPFAPLDRLPVPELLRRAQRVRDNA